MTQFNRSNSLSVGSDLSFGTPSSNATVPGPGGHQPIRNGHYLANLPQMFRTDNIRSIAIPGDFSTFNTHRAGHVYGPNDPLRRDLAAYYRERSNELNDLTRYRNSLGVPFSAFTAISELFWSYRTILENSACRIELGSTIVGNVPALIVTHPEEEVFEESDDEEVEESDPADEARPAPEPVPEPVPQTGQWPAVSLSDAMRNFEVTIRRPNPFASFPEAVVTQSPPPRDRMWTTGTTIIWDEIDTPAPPAAPERDDSNGN